MTDSVANEHMGFATARDAAARAHVQIRELHDVESMAKAIELLEGVWHAKPGDELVSQSLLMAMAHSGNYVVGAFRGEQMLGACLGFFCAPVGDAVHSHIAAVADIAAGNGIGTAIKLHQRDWARARGLNRITWTFDPIIARNAYFNLAVLGASGADYLVDFYGTLSDAVNSGAPSDRILVSWDLRSIRRNAVTTQASPALVDMAGEPRRVPYPAASSQLRVQIPSEIAAVREEDPVRALRWRIALRETMIDVLSDGWRINGFDRSGHYLLERI